MGLITAKVGVTPDTLHRYLDAVDVLDCTYQLLECTPWKTRPSGMIFELCVDGSESTLQVTLLPDGTWSATTHVVVGTAP